MTAFFSVGRESAKFRNPCETNCERHSPYPVTVWAYLSQISHLSQGLANSMTLDEQKAQAV